MSTHLDLAGSDPSMKKTATEVLENPSPSKRTRVVKLKRNKDKVIQGCDVYIGRENRLGGWDFAATKWGNPFRRCHNESAVARVAMYKEHVLNSPELMSSLGELKGKVLGCWCKPNPCHGDVLVELIETHLPDEEADEDEKKDTFASVTPPTTVKMEEERKEDVVRPNNKTNNVEKKEKKEKKERNEKGVKKMKSEKMEIEVGQSKTRVVRMKRRKGVVVQDCDVYIGRQQGMGGWNLRKSKWHNPFKVKDYGGSAEKVVELYREYIKTQPELLASIGELKGKTLGCWCKPGVCHGDVLAELADNS